MLEVLHSLADPHRLAILALVRDRELTAGDIARRFDKTRQATSHHLKVLEKAGVLSVRKEGTKRLYQANRDGLAELRQYLEDFWTSRLVSLKRVVEQKAGERGSQEDGT